MDPIDRRLLLGAVGVAGLAALSRKSMAGPLDPPPGPITPTGVTIGEMNAKVGQTQASVAALSTKVATTPQGVSEPRLPLASVASPPGSDALYRITQPGAYYLTDNIQQVPGVACISIECDGVDLDCQGFGFFGAPPGSPPSSCVRSSGHADIEIYDAAFREWRGCPIDCDDCDDVFVSDCHFRHCTCPPGQRADGTLLPGAMIRCQDGCEIDDVTISSCDGCAVQVRDKSTVSDVRWSSCSGQVCVCRDDCCVEELEIAGCSVPGGAAGSPSPMLLARNNVIHRDLSARMCTCPAGFYVSGDRCVLEDACLTQIIGDCCVSGRDACRNDIQLGGCQGRGIVCDTGACVEDVSFHQHVGDCVVVADHGAVCDIECRACTGVAITCGAGACVEEVAISGHTGDCVRCADGSCVTETECRNVVGIAISVGRSSLIEDCDVSGGGGGGSYRCLDGSSVRRSRSASRDDSMDIAVTDRCTVQDCTVTNGQGMRIGSRCCVSGNELSACDGGPDSTAGVGGAILVLGAHTSVEENQLTDCRIGISVQASGAWASIDDNHISASSGGPGGGPVVAGIVVAQGASGVMCTCNHLRVGAATPFVPGSSSFGPLISVPVAGGDLSLQQGSAHHLANYIVQA